MFTCIAQGHQVIRITEDTTTNFDIAKWVMGDRARVDIIIDSGVTINSTDASIGAIYSSVPINPDNSLITIRNNGTVLGCNGAGGNAVTDNDGLPGSKGCDCIDFNCPIVLYNISGSLQSGGGGGGGGGGYVNIFSILGGGGAGYPGGSGSSYSGKTSSSGETVQYGTGAGGAAYYDGPSLPTEGYGGDCNGAGQVGQVGYDAGALGEGGAGGAAGYGVNAQGNTVKIVNGAANIIGDINGVIIP